jgi:hypothetical protein
MACNGHVITWHYMALHALHARHYMPLHAGQDANDHVPQPARTGAAVVTC